MATTKTLLTKPLSKLKAIAVTHFHRYIRNRDKGQPCISCGSFNTSDASHFFSAGMNPVVRFNPDNVHLSCRKCNYFLAGNLIPYRENLIEKIGLPRFEALEFKVKLSKQTGYKWDKFFLLETIDKYKALNKELND
jgi:hypothetical protein|tara:strand:+ start:3127 stop:3534 length:408 start_codon:yes stop_codon:yes gene_type:complete